MSQRSETTSKDNQQRHRGPAKYGESYQTRTAMSQTSSLSNIRDLPIIGVLPNMGKFDRAVSTATPAAPLLASALLLPIAEGLACSRGPYPFYVVVQ